LTDKKGIRREEHVAERNKKEDKRAPGPARKARPIGFFEPHRSYQSRSAKKLAQHKPSRSMFFARTLQQFFPGLGVIFTASSNGNS
jgi:hypothetical protein